MQSYFQESSELPKRRVSAFWTLLLVLGSTEGVRAHNFAFTEVLVVIQLDRGYHIDVRLDLDALALGVPPAVPSDVTTAALRAMSVGELAETVERTRLMLQRRIHVRADGLAVEPLISFPEHETYLATDAEIPTVLGVIARLSGRLPAATKELRLELSRAFGPVQLAIFEQSTGRVVRQVVGAGAEAPPFELGRTDASVVEPSPWRYLVLGYEHIVPLGLDHILFVCGLFLLSPKLKPLLWQISAFTIAHSVTLGLAILDVVSLPSRVVEPLIALSISYVAVENLLTRELKPWRPAVVFGFGLLHGLGFAGALREVGLPKDQWVAPLLLFNVGVELGQLSVIIGALLTVGWFGNRRGYRAFVTIPGSCAIALVGAYWCVQRMLS